MQDSLNFFNFSDDVETLKKTIFRAHTIMESAYQMFITPVFGLTPFESRLVDFILAHNEVTSKKQAFLHMYPDKSYADPDMHQRFAVRILVLQSRLKNIQLDVRLSLTDNDKVTNKYDTLHLSGNDTNRLEKLIEPSRSKLAALKTLLAPHPNNLPDDPAILKELMAQHIRLLCGTPEMILINGIKLRKVHKIAISLLLSNPDRIVTHAELGLAWSLSYDPTRKVIDSKATKAAEVYHLRGRLKSVGTDLKDIHKRGLYLDKRNRQRLLSRLYNPAGLAA